MTGTVGVGQQDPTDTSNEYNRNRFQVKQMLGRISTMKVVKVVAVYGNDGQPVTDTGNTGVTGFVDVQIMTNQIDGDGNAIPHGIINGVPFVRMQGGKNCIISDPEVGDMGMMNISDRDISSVKSTRGQANPGSYRQFDPADGIYMGSIVSDAPDQFVRFVKDGVEITDKNGNTTVMGPDGITITDKSGSQVVMTGGGITLTPKSGPVTINGDMNVTGEITGTSGGGGAVGLQTHTHSQPNDSHNDAEQETNPPTPGT